MRVHLFEQQQILPTSRSAVFAFFADAANLEAITPPWLRFRILTPLPIEMRAGAEIRYRLTLHGLPVRWLTRITLWHPNECFVDEQIRGPYRLWHHTHTFERTRDGTRVRDTVRYALGLGPLGRLAHRTFVRRDVERIFAYRARAVARQFERPGRVGA